MLAQRILVVDADRNDRLEISEALAQGGFAVLTAVDAEHGLLKLTDQRVDLIILELQLPGLDGMEVLRRLRNAQPGLPVLIATAHATVETAVQAMKLGAADYLRKPFTREEIRSIVHRILAEHQQVTAESCPRDGYLAETQAAIAREDYDSALEFLKEAIGHTPTDPEVYNLMGATVELQGQLDEAVKLYRIALCLDGEYIPARRNLGRCQSDTYTREGLDLGQALE